MSCINGAPIILLAFFLPLLLPSLGSTGQMSKLCMDPQCKEPLFASTFTREHPISHDNFLQGKVGDIVSVVAFKFSNRVDMMEAVSENGNRGMVYSSHIDLEPYVYALEAILKKNPKLYVVNADPTQGVTTKKLLGEKQANPEVLRDYEVHAKNLGLEVTHFEPAHSSSASSASHDHGGHGHSHSHHDHNHHVHHASEEKGVKEEASKEKIQKEESQTTLEQPNVAKTAPDPVKESPGIDAGPHIETHTPDPGVNPRPTDASLGAAANPPIETPTPDPGVNPRPSNASTHILPTPNDTTNTPSESLPQDPVVNASSRPTNESLAVEDPLSNSVAGKDISDKESLSVGETSTAKVPAEEQTAPDPIPAPALPLPSPPPLDPVVKIVPDPASIIHKPADTLPRRKLSTLDALGGMLESNKVGSGEEASGERVEVTTTASPPPDPTVPSPTSTVIPMTTTYSHHTAAPQPRVDEGAQNGKETATRMEAQEKPREMAAEVARNEAETAQSPLPEAELQQPQSTSTVPPLASITEAPSPSSTTSQPPPIILESTAASAVDESKVVSESASQTTTTTARPSTAASVSESLEAARDEPVGKAESPHGKWKPMTSAETSELPPPATTAQASADEKAPRQDYCHKDDCGEYHTERSSARSQEMNRSSGWYQGVGHAIRGVLEPARSLLPAPLCYFDLTGLLVLAFLLVSITMHLTNMCLSSGIGRDYVDGRVLHDCMTRLKEQELLINRYQQNAAQLKKLAETGSAAERILKEKEQLETRLHELEKSSAGLEKEHDSLKSVSDRQKENLAERAREVAKLKDVLQEKEAQIKELNHHNEALTDRLSSSSSSLEKMRRELEQSRQSAEVVKSKMRDKTAEVDRLEGRLHTSIEECNLHKGQCEDMQAQMDELLQIIAQLQQQQSGDNNGQPSAGGKTNGDENGAGSGGSGWSDLGEQIDVGIGDGDEEGTLRSSSERQRGANTTHSSPLPSSTADEGGSTGGGRRKISATALLEVAQLKAELKRTETDRDACRISLVNEQKEREALNRRMEQLREDLTEKRREAEQREKERHDLQSQCSKLLFMVEERDRKLESIEAERERLRTKTSQTESDLRNVEEAKRELVLRLKELERDMRRVEEVNGKLENRLYHEDRRLTSRIRLLEEQLVKAQAAASAVNNSIGGLGDLNMSGGSSDPELTGGNNALRALGSDVPSLWSDVEGMDMLDDFNPPKPTAIPQRQSQSRQGMAAVVPHRGSPFVQASESHKPLDRSSVNNSRAAMASRGGGEGERRGSATSRRRSRSTGRQSAKLTTATGSRSGTTQYPATVGLYGPRPLSARHNKSANSQTSPPQLYYSSEGSNGGRSPPPEMPLLSGVPPPGLAAKRPTVVMPVPVGSTAVSKLVHVQIHKPANLK